jgi:ketosteroid isomerase-like protein
MKSIASIVVICILLMTACTQKAPLKTEGAKTVTAKPAASHAEEEANLRSTDIAWSEAAGKKDAEAVAGFMSDDGATMPPNEPALEGKEAVKKGWQDLLSLKDSKVKWEPTQVQVSESGDMGFTTGTYTLSYTDANGGKVDDKGKYLEMWKKVDGKWKCYLDMYSSDMPAK